MGLIIGEKVMANGRLGKIMRFGSAPWGTYAVISYGGRFTDRVSVKRLAAENGR